MLLSERSLSASTQTTPTNDIGTNTGESLLNNTYWTAAPTSNLIATPTYADEKEFQKEVLCVEQGHVQNTSTLADTCTPTRTNSKRILQESQNIPITHAGCDESTHTPTQLTISHSVASNYSGRSLSPPHYSPPTVSSVVSQSCLSQSLNMPEYSDMTCSTTDSDRQLLYEQMKVYIFISLCISLAHSLTLF